MTTRDPIVVINGQFEQLPPGDSLPGVSGVSGVSWFNVKDYGALGDGSTDDTVAIQAAINACGTAGGGTVYFPLGTYIVGGALQDTSRSNAQLLLPLVMTPGTAPITITLQGVVAPPSDYSVVGSEPLPTDISIIEGTLNTASGTAPCLIGAHGPSGTFDNFSNINVVWRDLAVRMPANPALTAVDCSCCSQFDADNLLIDAGNWDVATIGVPTTSTSYGLKTPGRDNGASTRLGIVTVVGFYNGIQVGEHTRGIGVNVAACAQALVLPVQDHASHFDRILITWCQRGLVFTGEHYLDIAQLDIEHSASGTWVPVYDIDDASNYGHGPLRWHVVLAGTGVSNIFLVNGGANLTYSALDAGDLIGIESTDGSINVSGVGTVNLEVAESPKLTAARTFSYTGDATGGPTSFDGSGNVSTVLTLEASGVTAGTYGAENEIPIITIDAKGRATAASTVAPQVWAPLTNGDTPGPVFMADPKGQPIMVPIT